jgi:uncharacterized membrane protein YfcA
MGISPVHLLESLAVGLTGGVASGLLGVSPGGILVPITILVLGCEQHVAQGVSLFAQIPPTSLSGIKRYREHGSAVPLRWLLLLATGFVVGGPVGALAAGSVADPALRWTYVVYLTALEILLLVRSRNRGSDTTSAAGERTDPHGLALVAVGLIAGFSSGFMGIGGGLAITVGLSGALKVAQHRAQAVSLVVSLIPLTLPAAWVYWHQGWSIPWPVVGAVVIGLWVGTDLGARLANGVREDTLRRILAGLVLLFAIYMAYKALT